MSRTKSALVVLACTILGLTSGCDFFLGQLLVGSGISATESRETEPFLGLEMSGAIDAEVVIGEPQSIEVTGDDNIVPLVYTDVRNGTLVIKMDHRGRLRLKEGLTVTIVTPELQRLDVSGACDVDLEGLLVGEFSVDVSGASDITVTGSCDQLVANISGASELKAAELEAATVASLGRRSMNSGKP